MTRRPGPRPEPSHQDRRLLATARRRLTLQVGAALAAAVVLVGGVVWLLAVRAQRSAVDSMLTSAISQADDVVDPPLDVTLFLRQPSGRTQASPGAPTGLFDGAAFEATARDGRVRIGSRTVEDHSYRVRTARRGTTVVQAAYDLRGLRDERRRLLGALLAAGGVGLAAVATAGLLLGRRAVAPLGDALARQRRFVADAAHELRTPLTLLHTRAQVFERTARRGGATDLAAEATQIVADSGRLADVVDDLLLSAELGSRPDRREPVDLSRLAAEVRAAAAAHAAELGIALTGPDDPPPVIVAGAAPALRRAVAALVDNALGHTSRGGSVRVTVKDGDPVTLTVADSGVGLDMSTAGALFDRFARGQDSGDRRRFGLGLALVHEVVTNHHGRVTVAGAPGKGASFTLELPPHPRR